MGGGFGGCSINLIKKSEASNVIATIEKKYKESHKMMADALSFGDYGKAGE